MMYLESSLILSECTRVQCERTPPLRGSRMITCESSSSVERLLAKEKVAGSIPVSRFWPGSQVVRRWSAKPSYASAILAQASNITLSN